MGSRGRGTRRTNRKIRRNTVKRTNMKRRNMKRTNMKRRNMKRTNMKRRNMKRTNMKSRTRGGGSLVNFRRQQGYEPISQDDIDVQDMNQTYLNNIKCLSVNDDGVLELLVRRGRHSGIMDAVERAKNEMRLRHRIPDGDEIITVMNNHLSKGNQFDIEASKPDPAIAKYLFNEPKNTPLSKIAAYHLNTNPDMYPHPGLKATGDGVSYFTDAVQSQVVNSLEEGYGTRIIRPEWPHNKTLEHFNPTLGANKRQTADQGGANRPIAAVHLIRRKSGSLRNPARRKVVEEWVIADNRDASYPAANDIREGNIVGTPKDGPSQGPNCCWLGEHEWLVNVFSSDPTVSEREAIAQVKHRIKDYTEHLKAKAAKVFLSYMKAQISYVYAGGNVNGSGNKQDASGKEYSGNSNFIINMLPLFEKVCRAMDSKRFKPKSASDLNNYGIGYKAMCQSWTGDISQTELVRLVNEQRQGNLNDDQLDNLKAGFSIPSPHSQILFYVTSPTTLMRKVPEVTPDDIKRYAQGFQVFMETMDLFKYSNSFIFLH